MATRNPDPGGTTPGHCSNKCRHPHPGGLSCYPLVFTGQQGTVWGRKADPEPGHAHADMSWHRTLGARAEQDQRGRGGAKGAPVALRPSPVPARGPGVSTSRSCRRPSRFWSSSWKRSSWLTCIVPIASSYSSVGRIWLRCKPFICARWMMSRHSSPLRKPGTSARRGGGQVRGRSRGADAPGTVPSAGSLRCSLQSPGHEDFTHPCTSVLDA